MPSLYNEIKAGNQQLWVAFQDDEEIICAVTTQFMYYPLRVQLAITFAGADDKSMSKENWQRIVLDMMDWGKLHGCAGVEIVGRRGWVRMLKDIGLEESFTTVEGEI